MTDSKQKKVTTTIRFDPELHRQLTDFIHEAGRGKKPRDRPSVDAMVQAAVAMLVAVPDLSHTSVGAVSQTKHLQPNTQFVLHHTPGDDNLALTEVETKWVQRLMQALRSREQSPLVTQAVENVLLLSEAVLGVVEHRQDFGDAQPGSPEDEALARNAAQAVAISGGSLRDSNATKTGAKRTLGDKGEDREQTG